MKPFTIHFQATLIFLAEKCQEISPQNFSVFCLFHTVFGEWENLPLAFCTEAKNMGLFFTSTIFGHVWALVCYVECNKLSYPVQVSLILLFPTSSFIHHILQLLLHHIDSKNRKYGKHYAYSTGHFVLQDFLSTFIIIFFMLVDTLFTQCALKCKKCATQMMS